MKPVMFGKKINLWKWAFLFLVAVQLAAALVIWQRVTRGRETSQVPVQESIEAIQVGTFQLSRDQLNATLASYLKDFQSEKFPYQVYATNSQILFEGTYEVLGSQIPLYIYFQPINQGDGSIHLKVLEVSAGSLRLPTKDILTYIKKNYELPDIITIDAKAAMIQVNLPQWSNPLGLRIEATNIDLYNDLIIFGLFRENSPQ